MKLYEGADDNSSSYCDLTYKGSSQEAVDWIKERHSFNSNEHKENGTIRISTGG